MDKSEVAIAIALLSAAFSAWQGYSGHISAQAAKKAAKRKSPAFEIVSTADRDFPEWQTVEITARNFEPISIEIIALTYRKKGGFLAPLEAKWVANEDIFAVPKLVKSLPEGHGQKRLEFKEQIGAAGEQASRHADSALPKPTTYITLLASGKFDPQHLEVEWLWADGAKK